MTASTQTYNVVATRVLDAPPTQVWEAWRQPALLQQWWGPKVFSVPVARVDFREGGVTLLAMQAPAEMGGFTLYNTWTYTRLDPHQRLEFVLRFTDPAGAPLDPATLGIQDVPAEVPHVVTFRPVGEGQTEMTITEHGYTAEAARDLSRAGLEECLDKMSVLFPPG